MSANEDAVDQVVDALQVALAGSTLEVALNALSRVLTIAVIGATSNRREACRLLGKIEAASASNVRSGFDEIKAETCTRHEAGSA